MVYRPFEEVLSDLGDQRLFNEFKEYKQKSRWSDTGFIREADRRACALCEIDPKMIQTTS
jgi:hypothetical protein